MSRLRDPLPGKIPMPGEWAQAAACRGEDTRRWYRAPRGERYSLKAEAEAANEAKAVCAACPVIEECLTHAMRYREAGIWGGLTEHERKRLRWQALKRTSRARIRGAA